jgi:putative ABC transport system ATP-binding protein
MSPLIHISGLSKVYPMPGEEVHALRNVSLSMDRGEFVSVVGTSGSGKTTLLYVLGLLTTPTAGTYEFEGKDVSRLSDRERSTIRGSRIGFVFQSFHLLPQLSVLDNVLLSTRYAFMNGDARGMSARAGELLDRVGLGTRLRHRPRELSGGEMQRVAIARALLLEPSVILADEPTGNLDEANGEEIFGLLGELAAEGRIVVLVTHNLALADRTGRQIRLKDGEVLHEHAATRP